MPQRLGVSPLWYAFHITTLIPLHYLPLMLGNWRSLLSAKNRATLSAGLLHFVATFHCVFTGTLGFKFAGCILEILKETIFFVL